MTLTTAVTDGYRTATNRLIETNWTHAAGVYFATQLGVSIWFLYLVAFFREGSGDLTFSAVELGFSEPLASSLFTVALVGVILAPIFYGVVRLTTAVWSRPTAAPIAVGTLVGPVAFSYQVGTNALEYGLSKSITEIANNMGQFLLIVAIFAVLAILAAVLIGGTYALSAGRIRPSRRQRRALVVVALLVVAVPIGVGAAFPMDDGSDYDPSPSTDSETNVPDEPAGTTDENDTSDDDAGYEAPNATDPAVYDNGRLSPYIESVEPLEGETDAVATVADPRPPTDNESYFDHPIAETHTDPDVTISKVNATVRNGTVVPDARYHLDFEGANTSAERVFSLRTYESTAVTDATDSANPMVWHGTRADVATGFYLEMEQIESTHLYVDLVTDDGEIHRYVVGLERTE